MKMIVTYVVQTAIQTIEGQALESILLTGTQEQVETELKERESELTKSMILLVANPKALALTRVRLKVVTHLLTHDMNKVPVYPKIGEGQIQLKDPTEPMQFIIMFKVTRRPIEDGAVLIKPDNPPVKLIIP